MLDCATSMTNEKETVSYGSNLLKRQVWQRVIGACFLGALLPLAHAPCHFTWLAWVSTGGLAYLFFESQTRKEAVCLGFLFGLTEFSVGVSWVYISIHDYGHVNHPMSLLLTVLLISYLAIYPAVQGYLVSVLTACSLRKLCLSFPLTWVLLEGLRSYLFSGFPWLILGSSQTDGLFSTWLPWFGVYGVGFILLISSCLMLLIFRSSDNLTRVKAIGFIILILGLTWLSHHCSQWTEPVKQLRVSVIQGNITRDLKWSQAYFQQSLMDYHRLTQMHLGQDFIVWPESALILPYDQLEDSLYPLDDLAKQKSTALVLGIPFSSPQDRDRFFNGILVLGAGHGRYHKQKLVPFGEYLPLAGWLQPWFQHWSLPVPMMLRGNSEQPQFLSIKGSPVASFICYDIAFNDWVRRFLPKARLILTLSDDAWFGRSFAPAQHLQIARVQSLQTGRDQVMATNNGITALIGADGRIQQQLPPAVQAVLSGTVMLRTGTTPWVFWGDRFVWSVLLVFMAGFCFLCHFQFHKVPR